MDRTGIGGTVDGRAARRNMSGEERRQQIVDVAAELFDRAGYAQATMGDIAAAVGLAKPTLYHYFTSKDEILVSIHEEFVNLVIAQQERRATSDLAPEQRLLETMVDIMELMRTHRGHVRAFFEHHRDLPPDALKSILGKRRQYQRMVESTIQSAIEADTFRPVDTRLASLAVFGMCNWAYQWFDASGPLSPREIAIQFWGFVTHGLMSRRSD